jgi:cell division protein FtsL
MPEEFDPNEIKEQIEKLEGAGESWKMYLALTTALIAVIAAIVSLQSGNYADRSLLEKNNAVLLQSKASDQWSYYQAKGVKKNLAEGLSELKADSKFKQEGERYGEEQKEIEVKARELESQVKESNTMAGELFEKHHHLALAVTFLQIAIALSAMSALLNRKSFWVLSILLTLVGVVFTIVGMVQ